MRSLAAILAVWLCLLASAQCTRDTFHNTLHSILGPDKPVKRLYTCSQSIGLTKCLKAFSVWRAERALENPRRPNLTRDAEQFPWVKYRNQSDDELNSRLCDGTERLLQRRSLVLDVIPGYELQLGSRGNGTMSLDVLQSETSGRGKTKKLKKMFFDLLPMFALPGLVMAAVLPFILPGLKMMTIAAGMLNNMALMGAIFTLLRNNAFNDKYEHKVVYLNQGYSNDRPIKVEQYTHPEEHIHINHDGLLYSDDKLLNAEPSFNEDFDGLNDVPLPHGLAWLPPPRPIIHPGNLISPHGFAKD